MSQDPKPNIMRGIAAYANPVLELEKREYVKAQLGRVPVDQVSGHLVRHVQCHGTAEREARER